MEYPTNIELIKGRLNQQTLADNEFSMIKENTQMALQRLPKNRALIDKINQFGLQKN
ncbi:hypothetical protein D3C81_2239310 [compost metagenome]